MQKVLIWLLSSCITPVFPVALFLVEDRDQEWTGVWEGGGRDPASLISGLVCVAGWVKTTSQQKSQDA